MVVNILRVLGVLPEGPLPPVQVPRVVTWTLVVVAHLLPALAVMADTVSFEEACAAFFLELCLAFPVTMVQLCTSKPGRDDGSPLAVNLLLFSVLYGGIAVTSSVYAVMLFGPTPMTWVLAGFLLASDVAGLVWHWFLGGARHAVPRGEVFWRPMVRFAGVLVVLGWFSSVSSELLVFVLLLLVKGVVELALDLRDETLALKHRRDTEPDPVP